MVFPKITFPTRSGSTVTALEAIAERESIYRVLAQTTPENTSKDYASYTCDPHTRYPTLNTKVWIIRDIDKVPKVIATFYLVNYHILSNIFFTFTACISSTNSTFDRY